MYPQALIPFLKSLTQDPSTFTPENAKTALTLIMSDQGSQVTQAQIAGYLMALKLTKLDTQPSIVASSAQVLRQSCLSLLPPVSPSPSSITTTNSSSSSSPSANPFSPSPTSSLLPSYLLKPWVDIVGTGGDGQDTFNVSTTAGLIVASCDVYVAKVR